MTEGLDLLRNGEPQDAAAVLREAGDLLGAAGDVSSWLTHGRTYDEQRHSPLAQIDDGNVGDLGLAWYADLPTRRGIETTPLMVDGMLIVTGAWSRVYTYDARELYPHVSATKGRPWVRWYWSIVEERQTSEAGKGL